MEYNFSVNLIIFRAGRNSRPVVQSTSAFALTWCNSKTDSKVWMKEDIEWYFIFVVLKGRFLFLRSNMKKFDTRKIVMIGMLSALAFVLTCLGNLIPIKVAGFLDYDPKDIIIVIAGFILGPVPAMIISLVVSLLELITPVSGTGPIGFVMNVISSCAFALPASVIYQKRRTFGGAILGLCVGVASMALTMVLWNYLITPLYMHVDRSFVAGMLLNTFLPFNLIKGSLNASLAMLLYKPLVKAMRGARLLDSAQGKKSDTKVLLIVVCVMVAAVCVLGLLVMGGVI